MDKIGFSAAGGWEAWLWGGVRMLGTLGCYTSLPLCTLSPSRVWLGGSFVRFLAQCFCSRDSLTPCSWVFVSGLLMPLASVGLHDLCPCTLVSLPHLQSLLLPSVLRGLPRTLKTERVSNLSSLSGQTPLPQLLPALGVSVA